MRPISVLIRDIRIPYTQKPETACEKAITYVQRAIGTKGVKVASAHPIRVSVDARKKPEVFYVCTVCAQVYCSASDIAKAVARDHRLSVFEEKPFVLPVARPDADAVTHSPVIVGFGPAGMFCALILCACGMKPIILERGDDVEARQAAVRRFYETKQLDTESNIQFGAGGAGTFSDGKLMTRIADPLCSYVLEQFVRFGADPDILIKAKPHVGTDVLLSVVARIRDHLRACGCEIHFRTKMESVVMRDTANGRHAYAVRTDKGEIPASAVVLALGHSARDTYETLFAHGMAMEPKPFSVGVRIEHLQARINEAMYGDACRYTEACGATGDGILLPPAEYALSHKPKPTEHDSDPRGVYSFCMCPGGEVMAATSEEDGVVVNGMSRRARNGANANAALAVSVRVSDFGDHPMKAIAFQRELERAAFRAGGGAYAAPCQTVGDFLSGGHGTAPTLVSPSYMDGNVAMTDLHQILPPFVSDLLERGIRRFDAGLPGFSSAEALLTGVETRTSSPIRMLRTEEYRAFGCDNVFPIGEGAGYAGGITSAAVDGIRCAMKIIESYQIQS